VLLSNRRPHGRTVMNLFRKLRLRCTCSNSTSLPPPYHLSKVRIKPPSVHIPPKHTHPTLNNSFP